MSTMTKNDYLMILALESDPLMSLKDLSRKINVSWPTVKKRYEDGIARGIIRAPLAKPLTEELGLRRINTIVNVKNFEKLLVIERACNIYPYTKYRARMIGNSVNLYCQFEIPVTDIAEQNLSRFFDKLEELELIEGYQFLHSAGIRHEGFPDLTKFDLERYSWEYTWDDWFEQVENPVAAELPLPNHGRIDFEEFTPVRLGILARFSEDASIKQADLMSEFDLSRTEASRQYNYVQENFVRSVRLNYNRDAFDLTETFIFIIKDVELKKQAALYSNIVNNHAPFRFSIEILENNDVLIWGNMSMNHSNEFIMKLWKHFDNMQVWRLSTNDSGAMQYFFYPPNFDFDAMRWRDDSKYMVDQPLNEILGDN